MPNIVHDFTKWTDIVASLDVAHGVVTCTMQSLRDIDGYKRNGANVRANIERKLASLGIALLAPELPPDASDAVVMYRQGTPASEMVETLSRALEGGGDPLMAATSLRRLNEVPDPASLKAALDMARDAVLSAESIMETGDSTL